MSRVTRATPDQADLVGRLLNGFNTEFGFPEPTAEAFAARFGELLTRDDVLVLLVDGDAGFAFLTFRPTPYYDGPLAQLEELYVRPDRRGAGLGSELIMAILSECRARQVGEILINVDEGDHDTRRFYERHGFTNRQPGDDEPMLCYLREMS